MQGNPLTTQIPLRASANVNKARVISLSGAFTGAQAANKNAEPLGISVEWSFLPPIPDYSLSTVAARTGDPLAYAGNGQKTHGEVGGVALAAAGRVAADSDGSGKLIAFVAPGWSVGYVGDSAAPAGSMVEVFVDIKYIPS